MFDNGTDGSSTAPAPAEYTLGAEISALMGDDVGLPSESPEPATPADGAPPASADAGTPDPTQARSEGTAEAEHAGAPPADAAQATPDQNALPEPDPLADAKEFTYTVNGQTRTFDGIKTLGEHGAIVQPDALHKLQQRLSERDNLYERAQQQYQERVQLEQQYKALESLTTWHAGKDQNGQDRILTGADAVAEQRAMLARSAAALQTFASIFNDRELFASLVDVQQDPSSGQFYVAPNTQGQRVLQTMMENAAIKADQSARAAFTTLRSQNTTPAPSPSSPVSTPDAPLAPEIVASSVDNAIRSLGVQGLTDADKATLAEALPRYIRATTPEERAVTGHDRVMDASFGKLILHTAELRKATAQQVQAATAAAQSNQRTLAQAARGKPQSRPAQPSQPTTAPEKTDSDRAWELMTNLSSGRVGTGSSL